MSMGRCLKALWELPASAAGNHDNPENDNDQVPTLREHSGKHLHIYQYLPGGMGRTGV